jgi:hypothetical protein
MPLTAASKKAHYKAAKSFVLLFNRGSMYGMAHPYSVHALDDFHRAVLELLEHASPVVLIHSRGQFFLEDEPLDRSLNVSKMSAHFKKADVTSISFERDVPRSELEEFFRLFLDTRNYPNADSMRRAAAARGVARIRINHIFYQKVTENDQVVSREEAEAGGRLGRELDAAQETRDAAGLIAGRLLADEIDHELGLKRLLSDPASFAQGIVHQAPPDGDEAPGRAGPPPGAIQARLAVLRGEIGRALAPDSGIGLTQLAESLVKMRTELLARIDARKALGLAVDGEHEIQEAAASLADPVMVELVRKEYDHGRTPVDRLAFILHRLVPAGELTRLLPALRAALMGDGMSGDDFMALVGRLGLDCREEGVAQALREGADSIGVDPGSLIARLTADPSGFARFLYLASEIEREAGSRKPLCDILVEHLERMGAQLATRGGAEAGGEAAWFRDLLQRFNARALEGLRSGPADAGVVEQVERRLTERLEASIQAVRSELAARTATPALPPVAPRTLLQTLEDGLPADHELKQALAQVRAGMAEQGADPNDFARILEALEQAREAGRKPAKAIDEIVFGRKHTLSLMDIEIARATRYGTDLSAIVFSIYRGASAPAGEATPSVDTTIAILQKLREKLRNTDWIGILNSKLFIGVLPMTTLKEAHLASRRLLKSLNAAPVVVAGRAVPFKLAGSAVHFDRSRMPGAAAFLQHGQAEHTEMAHRLRNLQGFM